MVFRSSGERARQFDDEESYIEFLERTVSLPAGFRAASTAISFTPLERPTLEPYRMNINAVVCDEPTDAFAGVFTRNAVAGAPVLIGRQRLAEAVTRGVLVNNKISNVCAPNGNEDAQTLVTHFAREIGCNPKELFPGSTGIIGWRLPVREMLDGLPLLARNLNEKNAVEFARGILTTDSFIKIRSVQVGAGSIVGIAKGAGMIEPNMATMLVYLFTDLDVSRDVCREALPKAVHTTLNSISVDSDQSTSDMALLISSRRSASIPSEVFESALTDVCRHLSEDIVRNGEGTAHVIRVRVEGCRCEMHARLLGKAVVNSPLVKTAIYGNDPNVGRIVGAVGDCAGNFDIPLNPQEMTVSIGDLAVFEDGVFHLDREKEIQLSSYLKRAAMNPRLRGYPQHERHVDIRITVGKGSCGAITTGSDLSDEYVHENADYRS